MINGDGVRYGATLTAYGAFCSCPDFLFRAQTCKHAAVLALYAIRTPKAPVEEGQPLEERKPNLKLVKARPAWVASA